MTQHPDPLRDLGAFIREQRAGARLSLRRLSELAGISNPYLSQIERGLRRPSAEILQQIAHGLRISAETLYIQAGILDERPAHGDLADAILAHPSLGEEQKQTLLHIYRSFLQANEDRGPADGLGRPATRATPARRLPAPIEVEATSVPAHAGTDLTGEAGHPASGCGSDTGASGCGSDTGASGCGSDTALRVTAGRPLGRRWSRRPGRLLCGA